MEQKKGAKQKTNIVYMTCKFFTQFDHGDKNAKHTNTIYYSKLFN